MSIYHALINALSAHVIHINLNAIFCTYIEDSPTKTIYIRHYTYTHTHSDCSRNWVLILVGAEILWEEEGFQYGFKRRQGWAVSKRSYGSEFQMWGPEQGKVETMLETLPFCISIRSSGFNCCSPKKISPVCKHLNFSRARNSESVCITSPQFRVHMYTYLDGRRQNQIQLRRTRAGKEMSRVPKVMMHSTSTGIFLSSMISTTRCARRSAWPNELLSRFRFEERAVQTSGRLAAQPASSGGEPGAGSEQPRGQWRALLAPRAAVFIALTTEAAGGRHVQLSQRQLHPLDSAARQQGEGIPPSLGRPDPATVGEDAGSRCPWFLTSATREVGESYAHHVVSLFHSPCGQNAAAEVLGCWQQCAWMLTAVCMYADRKHARVLTELCFETDWLKHVLRQKHALMLTKSVLWDCQKYALMLTESVIWDWQKYALMLTEVCSEADRSVLWCWQEACSETDRSLLWCWQEACLETDRIVLWCWLEACFSMNRSVLLRLTGACFETDRGILWDWQKYTLKWTRSMLWDWQIWYWKGKKGMLWDRQKQTDVDRKRFETNKSMTWDWQKACFETDRSVCF